MQTTLPLDLPIVPDPAGIRAALKAARLERKQQEEIEKNARRGQRAAEYKRRHETQVAICGINFYTRRVQAHSNWTHCRECGAALKFFDNHADAQANAGACKPYTKPALLNSLLSTPDSTAP